MKTATPSKFRARLRTAGLTTLALCSGIGVAFYVDWVTRLDPFAALRPQEGQVSNPVVMRLTNVDVASWKGDKKITGVKLDAVEIRRDFQVATLYGAKDGHYYGDKFGFDYDAKRGMFNPNGQVLEAYEDAHVHNADFDLHLPGFVYNVQSKLLTSSGGIHGRIKDGHIDAGRLSYQVNDGAWSAENVEWQGKPTGDAQNAAPDDASHIWKVKSPKSYRDNDGNEVFIDARATDGNIIIKSPKVVHNPKTDVITADGPVKYWSPKANVVCDKAVIYRKEKRSVLTGNVVMYLKPKDQEVLDEHMEVPPFQPVVPDDIAKNRPPAPVVEKADNKDLDNELRSSDTIRKYPATIRADKIDYWYGKGNRHAVITGSPQAQQELPGGRWRRVWTHEAFYDGEKEILKLQSSADKVDTRVKSSMGDDLVCTSYSLSTKDGDDWYEAENYDGQLASNDEEANEAARKAGDKDKESAGKGKGGGKAGTQNPH